MPAVGVGRGMPARRALGTLAVAAALAGCASGAFPAGDTIGTANYMSEVNYASLAPFLTGASTWFGLGLDVRVSDPAFGTRQCVMKTTHTVMGELTFHDDYFLPCANGVASQIDGLGHIGSMIGGSSEHYGGRATAALLEEGTVPNLEYSGTDPHRSLLPENLHFGRLKELGLDGVPPFVTRGILLDMVALFNETSPGSLNGTDGAEYLEMGTVIDETHIEQALTRQGLDVRKGDVVLFHTGWINLFRNDPVFLVGEPGITKGAAAMLIGSQVAAVGADTWGLEVLPSIDSGAFPVHQQLIRESGTYILENMETRELAAANVSEFLFVLGQVKVQGAVQAVINPVAIAKSGYPAGSPSHESGEWGAAENLLHVDRSSLAPFLSESSKSYSLGLDIRTEDPAFGTRQCVMYLTSNVAGDVFWYDDYFVPCANGVGSQMDGLGHIGTDGVYYGGNNHADMIESGTVPNLEYNGTDPHRNESNLPETLAFSHLKILGTEQVPPFVTRGILLDMVDLFTDTAPESLKDINGHKYLDMGTAFNKTHVEAALTKRGLQVRRGDVVLFYTGWIHLFRANATFLVGEPGITKGAAAYLIGKQVAAVGADTWGLEVLPSVDAGAFPVHQLLIKEHGTFILENMDTRAMVADGVYEFLFVLGHAKYQGAVQALINPVAVGVPTSTPTAASTTSPATPADTDGTISSAGGHGPGFHAAVLFLAIAWALHKRP